MSSKLIILRGNSGSGKSCVAKKLQEESNERVAVVEQDYLRRIVLREKERESTNNIDLIYQTVRFALDRGYHVVLEGILNFGRYGDMLQRLCAGEQTTYTYYFNIPFEETLKRHATKPNSCEFGEDKMRDWFKEMDVTGFAGEVLIPEDSSLENTVALIREQTGI